MQDLAAGVVVAKAYLGVLGELAPTHDQFTKLHLSNGIVDRKQPPDS
jgi:hypothetical protein